MTDRELRELEREAPAGGPAARLRLGRALVRAGRRDEALDLLAADRDDAEVRRELARLNAWSAPEGAGGTRFADVRGLVAPVVRWTSVALDAETGARRFELAASARAVDERGILAKAMAELHAFGLDGAREPLDVPAGDHLVLALMPERALVAPRVDDVLRRPFLLDRGGGPPREVEASPETWLHEACAARDAFMVTGLRPGYPLERRIVVREATGAVRWSIELQPRTWPTQLACVPGAVLALAHTGSVIAIGEAAGGRGGQGQGQGKDEDPLPPLPRAEPRGRETGETPVLREEDRGAGP